MIGHSGIGVYLRRLLPGVMEGLHEANFGLVGDRQKLSAYEHAAAILAYDVPIYSPKHHYMLPQLLGRDYDLLWTPHFNAPCRGRFRQVATIHDVIHLARPEFFGSRLRHVIAKWWYGQTVKVADRLIVPSEFTASELSRFFPAAKAKLTVVHNFVPDDYASSEDPAHLQNTPYLLAAGNVKPHKNLGTLLEAFARVEGAGLELIIVGQVEGFVTGDDRIKKALENPPKGVRFLGFVDQAKLRSLYRGALAAVFPSHYEGFGLGPLESMALGTPVIASAIPTTEEVCAGAALTFDPRRSDELAARITEIANDPALRERLRAQGLQRAKAFSGAESIARTVEVLRSLLN